MSDNRKYYYLKLKENYFDDDSIVLLESIQDGVLYSNILLKLYLKSLKHGGRLQLDEDIPYTAQMIATITRQQIGTVERALQIFLKLGLVEVLDSGTFYMYAKFVGTLTIMSFHASVWLHAARALLRSYGAASGHVGPKSFPGAALRRLRFGYSSIKNRNGGQYGYYQFAGLLPILYIGLLHGSIGRSCRNVQRI